VSALKAIRRLLPTAADTDACGAEFGRVLRGGMVVSFEGELGAGKTAIVRAALRARGITGAIKSPTYAIVESYEIANESAEGLTVHHMDFYRLEHPLAWQEAGLAECFGNDTAVLIEWPSKAFGLPVTDIAVQLTIELDGTRVLAAQPRSEAGQRAVADWLGT
jgi:tRNA threonylcarbamoyladenosine biosynthesis protein TsaE